MIRYPCSACSEILESCDFVAGLPVICRHCHASVVVPRKTLEHPDAVVETGVQVMAPSPPVTESTLLPLHPTTNANDPEVYIAPAGQIHELPRRTFKNFFFDFGYGIFQIILGLAGLAVLFLIIKFASDAGLRRIRMPVDLMLGSFLFLSAGVFLIARSFSTALRSLLASTIVRRLLLVTLGGAVVIAGAWCVWELGRFYVARQEEIHRAEKARELGIKRDSIRRRFSGDSLEKLLRGESAAKEQYQNPVRLKGKVLVISIDSTDHQLPLMLHEQLREEALNHFTKKTPSGRSPTPSIQDFLTGASLDEILFDLPAQYWGDHENEVGTIVCIHWLNKAVGLYRPMNTFDLSKMNVITKNDLVRYDKAYQMFATVLVLDRGDGLIVARETFAGDAPGFVSLNAYERPPSTGKKPLEAVRSYLHRLTVQGP